jgi:hypothetical protein
MLFFWAVFILMLTGNHLRAGQGSGNVGVRVDKVGLAFECHREDINLLPVETLTFPYSQEPHQLPQSPSRTQTRPRNPVLRPSMNVLNSECIAKGSTGTSVVSGPSA